MSSTWSQWVTKQLQISKENEENGLEVIGEYEGTFWNYVMAMRALKMKNTDMHFWQLTFEKNYWRKPTPKYHVEEMNVRLENN